MTSVNDGPRFARTFALRRRGWDHHMHLQAAMGSEVVLTAQVSGGKSRYILASMHLHIAEQSISQHCDQHLRLHSNFEDWTCLQWGVVWHLPLLIV